MLSIGPTTLSVNILNTEKLLLSTLLNFHLHIGIIELMQKMQNSNEF